MRRRSITLLSLGLAPLLTAGSAVAATTVASDAPTAARSRPSVTPSGSATGAVLSGDTRRGELDELLDKVQARKPPAEPTDGPGAALPGIAAGRASRGMTRASLGYVRPTSGPVTQWYGTHPGIDIAPPFGTAVVAAHAGVVTYAGWMEGYGNHVEVKQDDGTMTSYSHLSAILVTVGKPLATGQQLGRVGSTGYSTGPHLHFEVHIDGKRTDPAVWLRAHGISI